MGTTKEKVLQDLTSTVDSVTVVRPEQSKFEYGFVEVLKDGQTYALSVNLPEDAFDVGVDQVLIRFWKQFCLGDNGGEA